MSIDPEQIAADAAYAAEADCLQWEAVTVVQAARIFLTETIPGRLRPFADWQIFNAENGFDRRFTADEMRRHNEALPDEIRILSKNVDTFFADD